MANVSEFDLIRQYFAPLSLGNPGAYSLRDDAACLTPPDGKDLVVTKDAMVAGVHFLEDDPPDLIARKLMRANISDLTAKGAMPYGYLLSCAWPTPVDTGWVEGFARGLGEDQKTYGIDLLGGDTVATKQELVLSLTAIGLCDHGCMVRRAGAQPGDVIVLTGDVGLSTLGLKLIQNELTDVPYYNEALDRYRLPDPPQVAAAAIGKIASSAIDVSDGLIADAGHIAEVSQVQLEILAADVPLSGAVQNAVSDRYFSLEEAVTGGDDYQVLFTCLPEDLPRLSGQTAPKGIRFSVIGRVTQGSGVKFLDASGNRISLESAGFSHF